MQGRMNDIMDEQISRAPEQEQEHTSERLAFTIDAQDEQARRALLEKKPQTTKKPWWPWLVGIAALAAVAALVIGLRQGADAPQTDAPTISAEAEQDEAATEPSAAPEAETEPEPEQDTPQTQEEEQTTGGNGVSYTVEQDALTDELLSQTVAVCGDDRLTNRELPYYYWQQYYTFASSYGSYASYFIDMSVPFDQQMCMFDETQTWQQYFLQGALNTYKSVAAIWQQARLAGYTLGGEEKEYLDELSSSLTIAAVSYGFEDADAYLQTAYGPGASMSGYYEFVERYLTASAYLQALTDAEVYTEEDISAFYDENAAGYEANGIAKDEVNMVNVRHILLQPTETNDDGTYTDAAWEAAQAQAQALYDEWKNAEHTEDSFAFMAAENSVDSSAADGGLIEQIYPGQMVEEFDAWCFDAARQPGDTGIVKTQFGYHIMYFSSACEHPYWYACAESDYLTQRSAALSTELCEAFTVTQTLENAALVDVMQG